MDKNFDQWNGVKKVIHEKVGCKFYQQRDIWWCAIGTNVGFEQDGVGQNSQRPVVILKSFNS